MIWEAVLGGQTHLIRREAGVQPKRRRDPVIAPRITCTPEGRHVHRQVHRLALLQTCRQIYQEAIRLLYRKNTFLFLALGGINLTPGLVNLWAVSLLPQRVEQDVRRVHGDISGWGYGGLTWTS